MEVEIISVAHKEGNFGIKKTRNILEKSYYIHIIQQNVERVVEGCVECLIIDSKRGKKEGLLSSIDKAQEPLGTYHIDHVRPLTDTKKRYNHILAVVDGFSKFVWLYPTKSTGTEEVLVSLSFWQSSPHSYWQGHEYCNREGIQPLHITTGEPIGNGQVERIHKIVIARCSAKCARKTLWIGIVG